MDNYEKINEDEHASNVSSTEKQVIESFQDVGPNIVGTPTVNTNSIISEMDIMKFLSRPVLIGNILSTTTSSDFYPLRLFLADPAVTRILTNYKGLGATLNLRIQMATNPFLYGLETWSLKYNLRGRATDYSSSSLTTLQTIYMDASVTQPQEMKIPFQWLYDYINLRAADTVKGGQDHIVISRRRPVPYRSANSASEPVVSITLYAWLTDVKLVGSLPDDYIPQSSEYSGVISKPASIVSQIAGRLVDIPIIGNFAKATEIGSGAMAKMANIFGFSKPLDLSHPIAVYEQPHRNMYTSTSLDIANKLTIDPKQENLISPSLIGGGSNDPLSFKNFAERFYMFRSGITTGGLVWNVSDAVGTRLLAFPVSPAVCFRGVNAITPAPSAAVMLPFKFWRGETIFRLRVLASQFHRGKLRVYWSPNVIVFPTSDNISNTTVNFIIDIVNDKVIDIHIPWNSIEHFKQVQMIAPDVDITTEDAYYACNGFIYIDVLEQLSSPLSSQGLTMTLEVAAGDDFALAVPSLDILDTLHLTNYNATTSYYTGNDYLSGNTINAPISYPPVFPDDFTAQSAEMPGSMTSKNVKIQMFPPVGNSKDYLERQFGEAFTSFRPMFKAYQPYAYEKIDTLNLRGYMAYPHLTENDFNALTIIRSPTYLAYVSSFFLCRRGGLRFKIQMTGTGVGDDVVFVGRTRIDPWAISQSINFDNLNQMKQLMDKSIQGAALSGTSHITVEIPYQYPTRYAPAVPPLGVPINFPFPTDIMDDLQIAKEGFFVLNKAGAGNIMVYIAAAEDFTLDVFNGAPRFATWTTSLPPTA